MSTLWYRSLSKTPISKTGKLLIFDILWIICDKIEKYRKWLRKDPLEKGLSFFSIE